MDIARPKKLVNRIGIFSGTFDPVHRGHVEAALVSKAALELNSVIMLVEKAPHRKQKVAGFRHRTEMLELATANYPSLMPVDIGHPNITTKSTLVYLGQHFPDAEYWFIIGSDMLRHLNSWPSVDELFKTMHLCVVLRDNSDKQKTIEALRRLKEQFGAVDYKILPAVWSSISSSIVKKNPRKAVDQNVLDPKVLGYIQEHQLYDSSISSK